MKIFQELDELLKNTNYEKVDKQSKLVLTEKHLAMFDNPHKKFKVIHVAGSKGKGTVSSVIANIIQKKGFCVGLFTSPHIVDYNERINLVNKNIDSGIFERNIRLIKYKIEDGLFKPHTFFEILMVLAFLCFVDEGVEVAVVEVGIGGKHDCTNVVFPYASVITQIELEHTDVLGHTMPEIAGEKAGIIKKGVRSYVVFQNKEALEIIKQKAKEEDSTLKIFDAKNALILFKENKFSFKLDNKVFAVETKNPTLAYCYNYIFATQVVHDMGFVKPTDELPAVYMKGRFEILRFPDGIDIAMDMAHTPRSITNSINSFFRLYTKGVVIFSTTVGKSYKEMIDELAKIFDNIIITRIDEHKKSDEATIFEYAKQKPNKHFQLIENNEQALESAREYGVPILICGSAYLIGAYYRVLNLK